MPFTNLTFQEARRLLSVRLADTSFTFWTEEELGMYIKDALRYWSLLSQYYKDKATFTTVPGQAFYELNLTIPTFRTQVATDTDLIKLLCYHLMEPPTGTSWTGSEQFEYETILDSINRVRNRLIRETSSGGAVDLVPATPPPVQRVYLDENVVDLLRVAWKSATGSFRNLRQRDTVSRRSFNPTGSYTPGTPVAYQRADQPHNSIELWPPSNDEGHLEIITTSALPSPTGQGVSLGVPDDFVPILKWGVLSDLLSQERAMDAARAQYCEDRWEEGLKVAEVTPSVWGVEVNGRPVATGSLAEIDAFRPNWENTAGVPTQVAMVGLDLMALSPVPDGAYSVTLDLTRNAILPVADGDFIQLGKELQNGLFDYCVHLATFKQGGAVFAGTKPQYQELFDEAQNYNQKLKAQALYLEPITDHTYREQRRRPVDTDNDGGSVKRGAAT